MLRSRLDGSYKTYFRPLRQTPLPYPLTPGEDVQQSVSISIDGPPMPAAPAEAASGSVSVAVGGPLPSAAPFPKIGLGVPAEHAVATAAAMREHVQGGGDGGSGLLMDPQFLWCTLDARGDDSSGLAHTVESLRAFAEMQVSALPITL